MAKPLRDITPKDTQDKLKGVKSSEIVPGSTGDDPGVDYASQAKGGRDYVAKHKTEKHLDRVGNKSNIYQATNITPALKTPQNSRMGRTEKESEAVYESKECNCSKAGCSCPVHGMKACPTIKEDITPTTPTKKIIKDFIKSDNPRFDGKSKAERIRMALGAKYSRLRNEDAMDNVNIKPNKKTVTKPGSGDVPNTYPSYNNDDGGLAV